MPQLHFTSDYMEGAHPSILSALLESNLEKTEGYGFDPYCDSAKEKIRAACRCPDAAVYFLVGGTQTNATVIDALLRSYQGVLCAETGHISTHEAGAIEFGGHKVLTLPHQLGKISAEAIAHAIDVYNGDANREHTVMPGMVYLSQPTEYGTLYSLAELTAIHDVCRKHRLPLYIDGARLAYALASPDNDVTLPDLARLCDVFYVGGTKCGALLGEAVVIPDPERIPHFCLTGCLQTIFTSASVIPPSGTPSSSSRHSRTRAIPCCLLLPPIRFSRFWTAKPITGCPRRFPLAFGSSWTKAIPPPALPPAGQRRRRTFRR